MPSTAFTKSEEKILNTKTTDGFVDMLVKSGLAQGRKAALSREWRKRSGVSSLDLSKARNRHPYWKAKKSENSAERTKKRIALHDYSNGKGDVVWTDELLADFLDRNKTMKNGKYEHPDHELAKHFGTTIPSIQYMRRKYRAATKLLNGQTNKKKMVEVMCRAETVLKRGPDALEKVKTKIVASKTKASTKSAKKPDTKKALTKKPNTKKPVSVKAKPQDKVIPTKKAVSLKKKPAPKKSVSKTPVRIKESIKAKAQV